MARSGSSPKARIVFFTIMILCSSAALALVVYCKVVFDAAAWDAGSPVPLGIATASITLGYVVSIIVLEHILAFATPSRVWVEALATLTAGGLFVATLILLVAPDPPMDCPPCVFGRGPSGSETSLNQITDGVTSPRTLFPAIFPIIQALSGSLGAVNLFWLFALLVSARMAARRGQTRVWQMPVAECFEKSQAPHDEEGNPTPPPAYSPRSDHPFESRTGGRHGRARHSRMATHPAGNMQAAQNTILRHERIIDRGMGMGDTMGGI